MNEITEVEVGPIRVVGMRRKGAYGDVGKMLPELFERTMGAGLKMAGPPLYLCHEKDMEEVQRAMAAGDADLEVALPIEGRVPARSGLKAYTIKGGRMARTVHKGPYDRVGEAYTALFEWMSRNGKQAKGPFREIYLNSPMEVMPSELLTEIQVPI